MLLGDDVGDHVGKTFFIGKRTNDGLLHAAALMKPRFHFHDFHALAVDHDLRIFSVEKGNIPVGQQVSEIAASVHGAAIRQFHKGFIFFGMIADVSLRYAVAEYADFPRFSGGDLIAGLIQNFYAGS